MDLGMKNALLLLLSSACVALVAWVLWRLAGEDGFVVLPTLALVVVTVDNLWLRRQLRARAAFDPAAGSGEP